jgi:hypothetical protein
MDGEGNVIGVTQVMNKLHGRAFTEDDVAIIEVRIGFNDENIKHLNSLGFFGILWFGNK